ncbi:MAG: hypothetical protein U0M95_10250 [Ruminococcus sp.]
MLIMICTGVFMNCVVSACGGSSIAGNCHCLLEREFTDFEIEKVKDFCKSFYSSEYNTVGITKGCRYTLFRSHYAQRNMFLCIFYPDDFSLEGYPFYSSSTSSGIINSITFSDKFSNDFSKPRAILFGFDENFSFQKFYQYINSTISNIYKSEYSNQNLLYTDVPIYDSNGNIITDSASTPPAPFKVSYTPNLSVGMKRSGTLNAPGSPNDGMQITTEELKVTISLNADYVDYVVRRSWEYNHAKDLGASNDNSIQDLLSAYDGTDSGTETSLEGLNKKLMFFITGADPTTASPRAVVENSVYTYLSKQKYSIVDIDNGDINGSTSTATYANGLYAWFDFCDMSKYFEDIKNITADEYKSFIENLPFKTINIKLENVYFTDDYPTYYPVLITDSTSPTCFSGFKLTSGSPPNGAIVFDKVNADGTKHDDTVYDNGTFVDYWENKPSQYVYLGNEFSFDDYPDYTPFKYNDSEYTTKGNPFSYVGETAYKPDSYQSVNSDGTFSEERTAEEQKKHDDEIRWQNNFSTDFGVGSITDLLNGTSTFYEFLTACIGILPSWFLTILASFFVVLLALVVIKFVL